LRTRKIQGGRVRKGLDRMMSTGFFGNRVTGLGLSVVAALLILLLAAVPAQAANLFVNSISDTATSAGCNPTECTLREAITASNASTTVDDNIRFDIPASACEPTTGVCTITPNTQLPSISDTVTIDGYTQDGAAANTSINNTNNAALKIELNGTVASGGISLAQGLTVSGSGASGTVIRGLVINRFSGDGLRGDDGAVVTVEGNFIGTDPTGTQDLGNGSSGVHVTSSNNRIGGAANASQNVISGNDGNGVAVAGGEATGNVIVNNHIGTDADAIEDLGNSENGVSVVSSDTVIGGNDQNTGNGAGQDDGSALGEGNIISGNDVHGVLVIGASAEGTKILGNHIGVDRNGSSDDVGNTLDGVVVSSTPQVEIGGTVDGLGNTVSENGRHGVQIMGTPSRLGKVEGNRIGTNYIGRTDFGNGSDGVKLNNVTDTTVGGTTTAARNLISGNDANGVSILGSSSASRNRVLGNFIGTDVDGTAGLADMGNTESGVRIETSGNVVGGAVSGARNVISGNGANGVRIFGTGAAGNDVQGNHIGTDLDGEVDLGNRSDGVLIFNGRDNTIGGTESGAGNTISGNGQDGIYVEGDAASGTRIEGNSIGTRSDGTGDLGNAFNGVFVASPGTVIGGAVPAAANTISGNDRDGVVIANDSATGNRILRNSIHSNGLLGINLLSPEEEIGGIVTENDPKDRDTGPNLLQNFPELTSITPTRIEGILKSRPKKRFKVQIFLSPIANRPTFFGVGETFIKEVTVRTNGKGKASFAVNLATTIPDGHVVTATATDSGGNTSEFSAPAGTQ
jgi:hypothetical protein